MFRWTGIRKHDSSSQILLQIYYKNGKLEELTAENYTGLTIWDPQRVTFS